MTSRKNYRLSPDFTPYIWINHGLTDESNKVAYECSYGHEHTHYDQAPTREALDNLQNQAYDEGKQAAIANGIEDEIQQAAWGSKYMVMEHAQSDVDALTLEIPRLQFWYDYMYMMGG